MVVFSYGLIGLVLFLAFFLCIFPHVWRATDMYGSILGGIILTTLTKQFYYDVNTGLIISVVAVALLPRRLEKESDPIRRAETECDGRANTGSIVGIVRAEHAVRMGQWTSPVVDDGVFVTHMLARFNEPGCRGMGSWIVSARRRPS